MTRDLVIKSLYELMLPESADEKRAYAELVIRELDALRERAEKAEAMVEGVPYVSLSNAEIAAMTPEHPLYKLVHGDRKCDDE